MRVQFPKLRNMAHTTFLPKDQTFLYFIIYVGFKRLYFSWTCYSGTGIRDDDVPYQYGSIVYIYNNTTVRLLAPNNENGYDSGYAIYTGTGTLTHICRMDFPIISIWVSPLSFLGALGVI